MSTEIDRDATAILMFLARAPRYEYVEAVKIATELKLNPDPVNDAMALLVDVGAVEWNQVMGTAPFDFGDAMITPQGRRHVQSLQLESQVEMPQQTTNQALRLFISHAAEDVDLAKALVDLISKALNLPAAAIRCTSVDGYLTCPLHPIRR